jgi:hypothetical protein
MEVNFRLHTIFIFFLIVSSNYLGELFPCKIQNLLTDNVVLKHLFGFLTLLFFVVLVDEDNVRQLGDIFVHSAMMYSLFILLINTNIKFFVMCILSLSLIYIINIKNQSLIKNNEVPIEWLEKLKLGTSIFFVFSTVIGFLVYMGEKKIEYKKKFNFVTFLFGKSKCRNYSPNVSMFKALQSSFL